MSNLTVILAQVEPSLWNDFLIKQAPVIVVLGLITYFMYKYFTSRQNKMDETLKEKDKLFLETVSKNQDSLTDLLTKSTEAINRNSVVQEQLVDLIKETNDTVKELSNKVEHLAV